MDKFIKKMDELYDVSYISKYGPDWLFSIFTIIIALLIVVYITIQESKDELAKNWNEVRCDPKYMALAGHINPPKDGSMTPNEYTKKNFQGCLDEVAHTTAEATTRPYMMNLDYLTDIWVDMSESLDSTRSYLSQFRDNISKFVEDILGNVMNLFIEFQKLFVSIKDFVNKILGIMASAIMASLGMYLALVSVFKAIYHIIFGITIALTVLAIAAAISIFGFPITIVCLVLIGFLIAAMVEMSVGFPPVMGDLFGKSPPKKPRIPKPRVPRWLCFDPTTKIQMSNGLSKSISEIKVNDKLKNGDDVYGVFKLSGKHEKDNMYKLNDVSISGNHRVKFLNNWVKVKDHPSSEKINYNNDVLYNLVTKSKTIASRDNLYLDYDDLDSYTFKKLQNNCNIYTRGLFDKSSNIFKNFAGGFQEDTILKMNDGGSKIMKDINVNDILYENIKVLGVLEMNGNEVNVELQQINSLLLVSTSNILYEKSLGEISQICKCNNRKSYGNTNCKKLYHLITDKNYFYIDNLKIYDYDYLIDHYLE